MNDTKYQIRYGLGGGFGGCKNADWEDCDAQTEDDASMEAWRRACEVYDGYSGLHGLRSVDDIIEEEGCDTKEAEEIYHEEREGWVEYQVRPLPNK